MADSTEKKEIEDTKKEIDLTGITIQDLLNPKFIEKLKELKTDFLPFVLGIDIDKNIIIINHHEPAELQNKILHIECRSKSGKSEYLEKISAILKTKM